MLLKRADKEQLVQKMTDSLGQAKTVIFVNYQGLKVKEIEDLKANLRENGVGFEITKNSLLKIALKNRNINFDETLLDQPIAAVWGLADEVVPAKKTVEFTKSVEKLQIVGGIVNNQFADQSMIKQLAALPGRDELYAKLVGSLNAPMVGLVNALQGNLRSLVYILEQYRASKA